MYTCRDLSKIQRRKIKVFAVSVFAIGILVIIMNYAIVNNEPDSQQLLNKQTSSGRRLLSTDVAWEDTIAARNNFEQGYVAGNWENNLPVPGELYEYMYQDKQQSMTLNDNVLYYDAAKTLSCNIHMDEYGYLDDKISYIEVLEDWNNHQYKVGSIIIASAANIEEIHYTCSTFPALIVTSIIDKSDTDNNIFELYVGEAEMPDYISEVDCDIQEGILIDSGIDGIGEARKIEDLYNYFTQDHTSTATDNTYHFAGITYEQLEYLCFDENDEEIPMINGICGELDAVDYFGQQYGVNSIEFGENTLGDNTDNTERRRLRFFRRIKKAVKKAVKFVEKKIGQIVEPIKTIIDIIRGDVNERLFDIGLSISADKTFAIGGGVSKNADPKCANGLLNSAGTDTICCSKGCSQCGGPGCNNFGSKKGDECCGGVILSSKKYCNDFSAPCIMPDPECNNGLLSDDGTICCSKGCSQCGGPGCNNFGASDDLCCQGVISSSDKYCNEHGAPCIMGSPGSFKISAGVDFNAGVTADLIAKYKLFSLSPSFDLFKISMKASTHLNVYVDVEVSGSVSIDIEIANVERRKIFFLGPIPIVIRPYASLNFNVEVANDINLALQFGYEPIFIEYGIQFTPQNGFEIIDNKQLEFIPYKNFGADLDENCIDFVIEPAIEMQIGVVLYEAFDVFIAPRIGLTNSLQYPATCNDEIEKCDHTPLEARFAMDFEFSAAIVLEVGLGSLGLPSHSSTHDLGIGIGPIQLFDTCFTTSIFSVVDQICCA